MISDIDKAIPALQRVAKMAGGRPASWSTPPAHYAKRVRWTLALAWMVEAATRNMLRSSLAHAMSAELYAAAAVPRKGLRGIVNAIMSDTSRRAATLGAYEMASHVQTSLLYMAMRAELDNIGRLYVIGQA